MGFFVGCVDMRAARYPRLHGCRLCHRCLTVCNQNLCGQRRLLLHRHRHQTTRATSRPFALPENVPYLQPVQLLGVPSFYHDNRLHERHGMTSVPTYAQAPAPYETNHSCALGNRLDLLRGLHERHELVGRVHTVQMQFCTAEGMVVDWIITESEQESTSVSLFKENPYDARAPQLTTPLEHRSQHLIKGVLLPWSILPNSVASLSAPVQMQTTSQYIPPGSTFRVFCDDFDVDTGAVNFKMANHSAPVLRLPRYIDPHLSYADRFPRCPPTPSTWSPRARFLIIMDFEATCDFGPQPRITPETSEIIEFPWVVLDTSTLEIVHEEQIYVRPHDMQGITEYCQKLTGISPSQCQQGVPLADAIASFTQFVETHILPFGENSFQIVTDGVWDLEAQLAHETRRKNIALPLWFTRYFDLRQEFRQFYSWFPFTADAPSIQIMLNGTYQYLFSPSL